MLTFIFFVAGYWLGLLTAAIVVIWAAADTHLRLRDLLED